MSETMNFRSAFHGFNREDVVHYIEYLNATHASEIAQLRAELENSRTPLSVSKELMDARLIIKDLEDKLDQQAEELALLQVREETDAPAEPRNQDDPDELDAAIEARVQAEFDRDAALEVQAQAEADRDAAQEAQAQAEFDRDAAQEALAQAEADRDAAQEALAQAEADRNAAQEALRQAQEELAVLRESKALSAEAQRDLQMEELQAYRRAERTERIARERAARFCHVVDTALTGATSRVEDTFSQIDQLTNLVAQQLDNLQSAVSDSKQALADATAALSKIRTEEDA